MNNGLTLNFVEAEFNKSTIKIYRTDYTDEYWRDCIDSQFSYSFYRSGNNIYAWKIKDVSEVLPSRFELVEVSISDNSDIFSRIVEASIVNLFHQRQYEVERLKHSSTWTLRLKIDEINNQVLFQGLRLSPYLDFSVQTYKSKVSHEPIVGISLRKRYRPEFLYTDADFKTHSIDTRDWLRNENGEILPIRENFEKYLSASGQESTYYQKNISLYSDEKAYDDLVKFHKSIVAIKDKLFLPDGLIIKDFLFNHLPNAHFELELIKKPVYYYLNERTMLGALYDTALETIGPASLSNFSNRGIKLLILTPRENEGSAGSFSKRLEEKLMRIFHITKIEIAIKAFDKNEGYLEAINHSNLESTDLVVIFVSEKDKQFEVKNSPYFLSKSKLLNQQIPSQDVTIEKVKLQNQFIEKNIALNIYSKIGGVAWTIEKDQKDKKELIVGIGTTVDWEKNRRIGFANVFDYNGTYLVGDCSQISTKDNYIQNLETYLKQSIHDVIEKKGISTSESFRLIFHIKKEAGYKTEIFAIENALKNFPNYQIQYAILHLSYNHNLRIYNNGGKFKLNRGTFVQLSENEALLHLGGTSVLPILIRVDYRSTYNDIFALSQQVLFFSHLSQRSFRPANEPVTTKYPTIMAKLTSDLSQLNNWDITQLDKLKDKLWFI